jgi:Zn-dependent M16 (insulinase) family peptidase
MFWNARKIYSRLKFLTGVRNQKWASVAAKTKNQSNLKPGDKLHGFLVNTVETVPELQLTAYRLRHEKTGGDYLHIDRNDNNNVFAVAFRTTPTDSTGLPHILEHTTLCGSEKYPCRDPFFKMLNRSLATFMNAMTGPDYTVYPFATQNLKDYQNLMSVYLDAVFKPNLREKDFCQEGKLNKRTISLI